MAATVVVVAVAEGDRVVRRTGARGGEPGVSADGFLVSRWVTGDDRFDSEKGRNVQL